MLWTPWEAITQAATVVPAALGGTAAITNIQPLCEECYNLKGDLAIDYRMQWQTWHEAQAISDEQALNVGFDYGLIKDPSHRLLVYQRTQAAALRDFPG